MVDGVNGEEEGGFDPMRYAPWNDQYRLSTISTRMQLRHPLNRARRGTRSTSKKRIISAKIPDCLLAFNDGISFNLSLSLPLTILTSRDLEIYFRPFRGGKRLLDARSPSRNWFLKFDVFERDYTRWNTGLLGLFFEK